VHEVGGLNFLAPAGLPELTRFGDPEDGLSSRWAGASGGLFHWVTKTNDGIRVTDVWESREQFEKFSAEKVGPIAGEVGVPQPSKTTFFEVHNYLTKG
jgi:hypothetical protein